MAGYWIIRGTVKDQDAFAEYARLWKPIAQKYGAKFIAPGNQHQTREGSDCARAVIVEFESFAQAVACYDDPDYQASLPYAFKAYDRELTIVDGE